MLVNYLDTSALLSLETIPESSYINHLVFKELEEIKNSSSKDNDIKARAKRISRDIANGLLPISSFCIDRNAIDKIMKKHSWLPNNHDGYILAEAVYLHDKYDLVLWTADYNMKLFAEYERIKINFVIQKDSQKLEPWNGWSTYHPTENEMEGLYAAPNENILGAAINEYCKIYEGNDLKDIVRWDGQKYCSLKYANFKNTFLNKNIKPLNVEQKMCFDLLQNQSITVKVLTGKPGVGKDYVQILHALDYIQRGLFDKIIFVRNLIPFKDAPALGFLAGGLEEKISWGMGPLRSILGEEGLEKFEQEGSIENTNLGFMRGVSYDRSIIYVSEGQNITGGGYKLLVSRCGQGSQLWVNGDFDQTDTDYFSKNNGLVRLTNSLKGNKLFGCVKLTKTERSETAELAAII